ncbi:class A beta-lactamase-related serine hydrolase [Hymenobacter sp. 5516J-16]|uniref:serine hydrolase n=1 Tax=Hymenobacter sp. 5516J-16 TaxID=2932253 RepID=UPI001FD5F87D|nr:serine hydrolase [Hymenobacter sp. 5516J-16]UOQ75841.1 class A beta-lactamase-related serine hydrolase [Hymenobacter sp. 5516J-16]
MMHIILIPIIAALLRFTSNEDQHSVLPLPAVTPVANSRLLDSLLNSDSRLRPVVQRAANYELQIIYTQINRDAQQRPHFVQHNFRLDAGRYFNPASLVKLPTAALALEKLNQLQQPGLSRRSPMATGVGFRCQTAAPYIVSPDSDRINTVGNYIKRMLLVSDNQAYNRLYEFLGQGPLNARLRQLGYPDARIVRRFAPCDTAANRYTNPIEFRNPNTGQVCYQQPPTVNRVPLTHPLGRVMKGRAYQAGGRIIPQPYDFTTANYLPLQDVTDMLKVILFPEAVLAQRRFNLTTTDYAFLRYYLHHTPHSSGYTAYRAPSYFDAYKKYLYYGRSRNTKADAGLHMYNVVGMSHGYLADVAYFADSTQHTEFMLSAVLYVNKDGVINDGAYEYESIGLPFLAALGQVVSQYEASRARPILPLLNESFPQKQVR